MLRQLKSPFVSIFDERATSLERFVFLEGEFGRSFRVWSFDR